jgi:fructose/tagatose bisphosphate aldolase
MVRQGESTNSYDENVPLTLQQIRDNCAKARAAMPRARDEHWAFGALNLDDEPTLKAVARAAQKKQAPVLVEVSQGEVDDIGLDTSATWSTILSVSLTLKVM